MNFKERIILILLASVNFTHIMDFMIMMPLGNFLIPHFDISAQQFSFLIAVYPISAFTASLSTAFFVDRFDRKKVLLFAYSGFLLGTLLCALAPTFILLMSARIISGLFGGLIGAQVLSIVADLVPFARRGRAMGIVMAAFSVASVFGVPFGLYLSNFISWHAPFFFVVGIGVIVLSLLIRYLPSMTAHLAESKDLNKLNPLLMIKGIFSDKNQRLAILLSASLMLGHFLIIPFLNPFMEFNVGFTKDQTPLIYLVGGAVTLFSSPIIGRLADKYGKFKVFSYLVLMAVIPISLITNMPRIPFYFVLCITGFWFVVSTGRIIPAQAIISEVVPGNKRGSFMNINASIQQLAVGTASLLAGTIVVKTPDDKILNYDITGYISIAVILSCLYTAYRLNKAMKFKETQKSMHKDIPTYEATTVEPVVGQQAMPVE